MPIARHIAVGMSLILVVAGCVGAPSSGPLDVSLIQLIANPEKYDGKFVRVIGYLRLEFEGNALYVHREDDEAALTKNAIWVDATSDMTNDPETFNRKYVLLEGIFDAKQHGHMDLFSGELRRISRADVWYPRPVQKKGR